MLQLFPEPALPRDRWLRVNQAMGEPHRWFQVALTKAENCDLAILRNGKCRTAAQKKTPAGRRAFCFGLGAAR